MRKRFSIKQANKLASASKDTLYVNPKGRKLNADGLVLSIIADKSEPSVNSYELGVINSIKKWRNETKNNK